MTDLIQRTVTEVRPMTLDECEAESWHCAPSVRPPVIVFDDDTKIYPTADPEGNGPGALFGVDSNGDFIVVSP
jgi:hypothetical protein